MDSQGSGSDEDAATRAQGTGEAPAAKRARTRRQFLRDGGIAATGLVVGGAIVAGVSGSIGRTEGDEEPSESFSAVPPREVPGFDHVVVLMGENRSFDNLLGWLYTSATLPQGET